MTVHQSRMPVSGSERAPLHGAKAVGPVPRDERFEVTVRVRRKAPLDATAGATHADQLPSKRRYMTREEYATKNGSDPADLAKIEAFARAHGLVVVESSPARRSVFLSGTAAQFEAAFGTAIQQYEHDGGTYRGRTGALMMPTDMADLVEGVFGIDDRPAATPHFQRTRPAAGAQPRAAGATFTPPELAKLYNFPTGLDGSGQCIAIIELGGGFRAADITAYFHKLGLPVPNVKAVRVDGARNLPSNANSDDGEVMLDIEVAAAVAPKARIAVYFAPNTTKGFLDAITAAIHDTVNKPSVISISWGNPEKNWTRQATRSFDQAFQTAAALGVTVCCAAGDAGSGDENPDQLAANHLPPPDGLAHADFPGSSPFALCCGGTKLTAAGGAIASETVWNADPTRSATGGGVSAVFPVPAYQAGASVPVSVNPGGRAGRGVPDVAGDADPATGYEVRVDGQEFTIGGTSAVAPLWAGLIALVNQRLGHPVGFLNPMLYGSLVGSGAFRDVTSGNNGAYTARAGWDACTGWGTPNGTALLQKLMG
ncbi:S8/S53 family peptidase [Gemmata sp. G18]|uniref:S8/S53 family peptidase n=1 Tax=Gemmata palustris TaxID=2822762 RepID=A0ABS5BTY5_9BACT|nr:S53 family peptidase [Gemmata palustris]MBP3957154.1 S8/S53 family peptidase [Gemmata palustris]